MENQSDQKSAVAPHDIKSTTPEMVTKHPEFAQQVDEHHEKQTNDFNLQIPRAGPNIPFAGTPGQDLNFPEFAREVDKHHEANAVRPLQLLGETATRRVAASASFESDIAEQGFPQVYASNAASGGASSDVNAATSSTPNQFATQEEFTSEGKLFVTDSDETEEEDLSIDISTPIRFQRKDYDNEATGENQINQRAERPSNVVAAPAVQAHTPDTESEEYKLCNEYISLLLDGSADPVKREQRLQELEKVVRPPGSPSWLPPDVQERDYYIRDGKFDMKAWENNFGQWREEPEDLFGQAVFPGQPLDWGQDLHDSALPQGPPLDFDMKSLANVDQEMDVQLEAEMGAESTGSTITEDLQEDTSGATNASVDPSNEQVNLKTDNCRKSARDPALENALVNSFDDQSAEPPLAKRAKLSGGMKTS